MSEETKYQGWANYPTWKVAVLLQNDRTLREYWKGRAQDASAIQMASEMRAEYWESMPELSGIWGELLSAAFGEVNWMEIARFFTGEEDLEDTDEQ